ncbi:MAG: RagB/SusD family nutrient uptake outer membrane protein [Chitinophagaceae bacterium]|nr:RagB/SusD family nutrient uptake outer membrane protein [Chitinophagaceae bacterium]NDB52789.1 RagB/SusD family nutrient uptake outer membrane protein [Chitinophagaceae bacterium]
MKYFVMKNISAKFLLVVMVLTTFSSCKKSFLELNPPTNLTPAQALSTEADLLVALRGAYAGLRATAMYGRSLMVIGDMMADNTYQSVLNTNRYTLFNNYTYNVTDGDVSGLWQQAYTVILRVNNIINANVSGPNVNQYKGEARAIRALCYFELVRYFARPFTDNPNAYGVPLVTVYNADLKPGRSTVAEVYNQIHADLNSAYNLMTAFTNSSQFSKFSARALQARVYLTQNDKTNAKTAALDVINNGGFTAVTAANHAAYWANSVIRTDKVETLFEVSADAVANNAFDALAYIYSQAGNYGDMLCADDLYALFEANDVRRALYATGVRGGLPSVFVNKYTVFTGDHTDTKVLRLSEMYLIAAEASLPADEAGARTYLNAITAQRGATAISSTGAALVNDLMNERRKELAFEGQRYLDMQRLKLDITRGANYPAAARSVPYANFRRVFPIPQTELDVNSTIKAQQNTGW